MVILDIANRQNKIGWGLIVLSAIFLELTALFFQYAMGLEPCIMCVYQRLAVAGILLSGLFGFLLSRNFWGQIGAHGLMMYATSEGVRVANEHVIKQSGTSFFSTCDLFPNFPSWFPLHEWVPSVFAATGDCSSIDWSFLGMSMPEWMVYIFWGYTAFQVCMLIWIVGDHADRVRGRRKNNAA
jgi:disulfide bond formation protein DsbB